MLLVYSYPTLRPEWLHKTTIASESEVRLARRVGLVGGPDRTSESDDFDDIIKAEGLEPDFVEKYFFLLLLNLFEQWFLLEMPLGALCLLVRDFRYSQATSIHDGRLPAMTAGISEIQQCDRLSPEYFMMKIKVHSKLQPYVVAAIEHRLFRAALPSC